ncbi:hypothetical protein RSOLAG1IB_08911 [Rhizoctonia solani AG-1 IB]|uniref:N-acetyltransferase domain-containing protein n=3 Tax=Rhizoctonia solani TaxID=456999 RepID=A0A8H2ZZ67_9AGAM|nr:unnamed protein product [Rhizoctonia solani]CEL58880.1 hypothetical protein RSOLAG1IB_08911 [Rhizoctonia solani AG-1 IB]
MSSPRSEYSDASSTSDFDATSIVYRPMNTRDIPEVESLHNELVKQRLPRMFLHQSLYHAHRRTIVAEYPTESGKPVLIGFASAHVTTKPDWPVALEPEVDLLSLAVRPEYRRHHIAESLIKAVTGSLVNTCRFKAGEQGALVHADIRCGHTNRAFFEQGMGWEEDKEFQRTLPWARCDATRFVTRVAV